MVQNILRFIKTHWISLACGVVGVVALVVAALGMTSTAVVAKMNEIVGQASAINSLRNEPRSEDAIAAEQKRTADFHDKYEKALEFAAEHNRRAPILAGVFPNPGQNALRYKFLEEYRVRLHDLPRAMKAGDRASQREAANEQEILDDLARRKAEQEGETASATPVEQPAEGRGEERLGPGRTVNPRGRGGRMPGGAPQVPGAGPAGAGGQVAPATETTINVTAEALRRAAIRKARTIPVYATLDGPECSFHVSPIVDSTSPPTPRDMWYAQVSLWVQHDVAVAIGKVNDETAAELGDLAANVTTLPVKRLVGVDMLGYLTPAKTLVGFATGANVSAAPATFTGRVSDERFDVLRFSVTVVMDQRAIPKLVDALTRENFYQLVNISFVAEPPDSERDDGFFYGPAPLVRATLDLEGYMARKVYKEMMPKDVLVELGIDQPATPPQ